MFGHFSKLLQFAKPASAFSSKVLYLKNLTKMSLEPFKTIDIKTLKLADAPSSNGTAGKSVWVNRDEGLPKNFTTEKDARLLWPIRPGTSDGIVRPNERLNLEIKVSPEEEDKAN
jgi:hypothetical protein